MNEPTKEKSVLPLTNGTYYLPLRQDFIALCETCEKDEKSHASPYCMALILSVMEKWTNEKKKAQVNLYVTMTYAQWESEIYGTFKRNTIIDSLQVLVSNKLLYREAFKRAGGGKDQYKYLLNIDIIKNLLATTFKNQLCHSPKLNDQSSISNDATSEKGLRGELNSSSAKFEKGRFKEKTSHYTESNKEEESASLSSPALSIWNIWCEAQGYELKRDWTKTERERCIALADMCEKGKITLTPQLMNEVREWAQAKQSFLRNDWALKNLINALPDYFKDTSSAVVQQQEMPEPTGKNASELVLWSRTMSPIITMMARGENSVEDHARYLDLMTHEEAWEYGYDHPNARHYTSAEIEQYKQLSQMAMAG